MSPDFFEVMEKYFLDNIEEASAKALVDYSFSHSALCMNLLQTYKS